MVVRKEQYQWNVYQRCHYHSVQPTIYEQVNKPATIRQVYPHFFVWIKPADFTHIIRQHDLHDIDRSLVRLGWIEGFLSQKLQNLPDVGRSLVRFWLRYMGNIFLINLPTSQRQLVSYST